ncbi:diguanylate cyclase [Paenibacillus sp. N1-5-1-14]|uniref:sensor domain-containing diguanylate cyclase n=1 Tax=Paenibacillus radicibacter TaxID=2972488 RepID=UPI002158F982|nr:diguanylate cyclase [Paenibacillus radicibacter]MCR8641757.1 diguanylate cyclase [Paenibacillus radicibacter]
MNEQAELGKQLIKLESNRHKPINYRLILPSAALEVSLEFKKALKSSYVKWSGQFTYLPETLNGTFVMLDADYRIVFKHSIGEADHSWIEEQMNWTDISEGHDAISICITEQSAQIVEGVSCAIPIFLAPHEELYGIFGFIGEPLQESMDYLFYLYTYGLEFINNLVLLAETEKNRKLSREINKREVLFLASRRLHSLISTEAVLTEVVQSLKSVYPIMSLDLYLLQDIQSASLPIKQLDLQKMDNAMYVRAFMDDQLVMEQYLGVDMGTIELAVPLSGKQGVYGVLHMQCETDTLDPSDIQFISMLADSGGSAFENAKLYEQSYLLISELRLINEITRRLNQSLSLNEIIDFVSAELIQIFGAEYFCILQREKESDRLAVQATNMPAMFSEYFTINSGFSGVVFSTKEPVIISDYWASPLVSSKLMEFTGGRSLIASPIIVNEEVMGVIMVVHHKPSYFSYDNYKLLQVLSGHIGLAMTNASLHAEVKRMVITDNLTGLYVRHYLDEQISNFQKEDFCGSFVLIDIDNFKKINDTYGHQVGDQILKQVSAIIQNSVRESDVAARWGGEELAIYLPHIYKEQTLKIAERIRQNVMKETNPTVTISCGVSDWNWEDEKISVETLFYKADMALYQAKNDGRNRIIMDSL